MGILDKLKRPSEEDESQLGVGEEASQKKQGRGRRRKDSMADVLDESVVENVLSDFRDNVKFIAVRKDQPLYVGLYLPLTDIGAVGRKARKNEDIGQIIESINSGRLHCFITPELLEQDAIVIIPDAQTVENMAEYPILTAESLTYRLVLIDDAGRLEQTNIGVTYDEVSDLLDTDNGSVMDMFIEMAVPWALEEADTPIPVVQEKPQPKAESVLDYDVPEELVEHHHNEPAVGVPSHVNTSGVVPPVQNAAGATQIIENTAGGGNAPQSFSSQPQQIVENVAGAQNAVAPTQNGVSAPQVPYQGGGAQPQYANQGASTAPSTQTQAQYAVSASPDETIIMPPEPVHESGFQDVPGKPKPQALAPQPAVEAQEVVRVESQPVIEEPPYTEEMIEAVTDTVFNNDELGIRISYDLFDSQIIKPNPFVPFKEDKGSWLDDYQANIVRDANATLLRMHQLNQAKARDQFQQLVSAFAADIREDLDYNNQNGEYGKFYAKLQATRDERRASAATEIEREKERLEAAWQEELDRCGAAAAEEAQAAYSARHMREHTNEMNRVEPRVQKNIEDSYYIDLKELHERRRNEARRRFDQVTQVAVARVNQDYIVALEQEDDESKKWQERINDYAERHMDESIVHDQVDAKRLRESKEIENTERIWQERMRSASLDYEERIKQLTEERDFLKQTMTDKVEAAEASAQRKVDDAREDAILAANRYDRLATKVEDIVGGVNAPAMSNNPAQDLMLAQMRQLGMIQQPKQGISMPVMVCIIAVTFFIALLLGLFIMMGFGA